MDDPNPKTGVMFEIPKKMFFFFHIILIQNYHWKTVHILFV